MGPDNLEGKGRRICANPTRILIGGDYRCAKRGSNRNGSALPILNLRKSGCRGLSRKLDSPGTRVVGTRSTAEVPPAAQSSPIVCTLDGAGSAFQFLGSFDGSSSATQ